MERVLFEPPPDADAPEIDLVAAAREGDREAFERLAAARLEPALRTATAILGREADAQDATQEVLVRAWRDLRSLRDVHRFDAWFGRILVNTCRTALRRRYRSGVREIPVEAIVDPESHPALRGEGRVEDQTAEIDLIERAFERLSADERVLLVLHHLDRQSVTTIAASLGIPEGTAKSRLYSARRALERAIEVEGR